MDEQGRAASAASAVVALAAAPGPALVRADRPFLLLVRERASGLILLLGRVARPESPA